MQLIRPVLFTFLLAILLAGCTPSNNIKDPEEQEDLAVMMAEAEALAANGQLIEAAMALEQLAALKQPPQKQALLLQAVEYYYQAEDRDGAGELLNRIDTSTIPKLDFLKRLLVAEAALFRNRPDEALTLLASPPPHDSSDKIISQYHMDRAEAFRLSGNLLESANELSELDLLMVDKPERLDNQLKIVQTLAALTDTALELLQPNPPGLQGGWMELTRIIKNFGSDPEQIQPQLEAWREQFPSHPAMPELLEGHFEKLKAQYRRPSHLALILPQNGPYAKAATALKDGFLAAYYQQAVEQRPKLAFYDSTNSEDVWPLYRQAVDFGADMIIGPLNKNSVAQFARAGELEVPVLALNQVPLEKAPPSDLYQFSLSPEDEGRQVAEKAWTDGHTQALVLYPTGKLGERIVGAFRDRWEQLGGTFSSAIAYDTKGHDFGKPIKSLLHLDESQARRRAMQQLLRKNVKFEPRRRDDADFIFLVAKPANARGIRPQIQFHHGADLPLYATSHIYNGQPAPDKDIDLEGIRFPDIPWLLVEEANAPLSRQNMAAILPDSQSKYRRLYAMGIDSYNLLPHLARLQSSTEETMDGQSGSLFLDSIHQVHRQLVWAEMDRGIPKVIGYAPRMALVEEQFETAIIEEPVVDENLPAVEEGVVNGEPAEAEGTEG
ncbi:MAG: penicillin-binding protein activator [Gammaproteobacteria bacterium]|nr:penicillin-binding protein activator [Gammaproteobacteria bacterium]